MSLVVVHPGPLTLVQDDGRPGMAAQGVGAAGAFDRRALHQARTLVGDASGTAVLEALGGGLELRATSEHVVAVTGAVGPVLVDGAPVEHGRAVRLGAGRHLAVAPFGHGLRGYVAVAGGIDVPSTLGSRSADTLSRLGPPALSAGDELAVGEPLQDPPDVAPVPSLLTPGTTTVDVVLGPRDDWFTPDALAAFLGTGWVVSERSDRIGVRLDHRAPGRTGLERAVDGELPSEPCVRGSVQVTSAGLPVVLGPDHPVTGGYPVIGVVTGRGLDRLAQVRPGETVRFRRHTLP
ncbi:MULTISPECIES: biotin-dependent carboxyltransferase family protein [unclassified Aeromicrobium]|uniref:5-oxoprolinase subunit C family protein n=1 Tax=unclassified Aeromicrobium TaxID=2633570 RepID=UPI00288954A2|nr:MULTISPECIES: biotin-dependent carboxyltransferase family protein [unclassified Aeromicrobium]